MSARRLGRVAARVTGIPEAPVEFQSGFAAGQYVIEPAALPCRPGIPAGSTGQPAIPEDDRRKVGRNRCFETGPDKHCRKGKQRHNEAGPLYGVAVLEQQDYLVDKVLGRARQA